MGEEFFVKINIDAVKFLKEVLEGDISYGKLRKLTRAKAMKKYIEYERTINKGIDEFKLMEEIIKLKIYEGYKDRFELHILKDNLPFFVKELENIKQEEREIIQKALKKVYEIIPEHVEIHPKIYLYAGGIDGGFTLNRKEIYINYIKYLSNSEELIKIISHELFHSRKIHPKIKFIRYFKLNTKDIYLYELFGKIFEEGIALLIQHGPVLKKDDPVGSLTKGKLSLVDKEFENLNNLLWRIKGGAKYIDIKTVDYYILGYFMVSFLYDFYGKEILLPWILELDYIPLLKSFIKGVKKKENTVMFSEEIENWMMNL